MHSVHDPYFLKKKIARIVFKCRAFLSEIYLYTHNKFEYLVYETAKFMARFCSDLVRF